MTYEQYLIEENERLKKELEQYKKQDKVKRGDIVYVRMKKQNVEESSVMEYSRPYLVVSNDIGNYHSNICIAVPLTSKEKKLTQPTHYRVSYHDSVVLCEQILTLSQSDIEGIRYHLKEEEMKEIDKCLKVSLALQ